MGKIQQNVGKFKMTSTLRIPSQASYSIPIGFQMVYSRIVLVQQIWLVLGNLSVLFPFKNWAEFMASTWPVRSYNGNQMGKNSTRERDLRYL